MNPITVNNKSATGGSSSTRASLRMTTSLCDVLIGATYHRHLVRHGDEQREKVTAFVYGEAQEPIAQAGLTEQFVKGLRRAFEKPDQVGL